MGLDQIEAFFDPGHPLIEAIQPPRYGCHIFFQGTKTLLDLGLIVEDAIELLVNGSHALKQKIPGLGRHCLLLLRRNHVDGIADADVVDIGLVRILREPLLDLVTEMRNQALDRPGRGVAQGGLAANGQAQVGLLALQQRSDSAKQVYEAYLNRAKQVAAEGSLQQSDASIASPAAIPSKRSSPNLPLFALAGTLLGLLAGALSMLAAELWGRALRSGMDIERDLGLQFAGLVPDYASVAGRHRKKGPGAPADYMVDQPLSSFAEALRNLRAFLLFSGDARPVKLLALTSAVPREGKSMTSFCLARALALSGSNVVVVDCDLRLRGLSKLMGEPATGIVQVVDGEAPLEQALVRDARTGLWVLPAAQGPIPYDLFSRPECDALLRRLAERFDYVLLDTPPILGVADARIIAGKVDRVLYVVHWNKTPLRAAQAAVQILRESGADIAGALLTRVNVKAQSRYGYADDSDYFQYYRNYYVQAA